MDGMKFISVVTMLVAGVFSHIPTHAYTGDQAAKTINKIPYTDNQVADLIAKSKSGNADAQRELSSLYFAGHHLDKDDAKARYWLKLAAENGDVGAQYVMYENYKNGVLFPQDPERAIYWCNKAAEQGFEVAECSLGTAYLSGYGVQKDVEKAAALFKRSADKDYAQAQLMIGMAYLNGEGVPQDMAQAFKWLSIYHFISEPDGEGEKMFLALTKECMSKEQITEGKDLAADWLMNR